MNIGANFNWSLLSRTLRWYWHQWLLRKPFPLQATLQITINCNFDCKFCNQVVAEGRETMPSELFRQAVDGLGQIGTYYLYITGGEPLLVKDIVERITYAKQRIPYIHLVTNGYLLDQTMAQRLGNTGINMVSVSVDGLEELHDKYRNKPGAFNHAFSAIHNLQECAPSVKIAVASQIAPWNIDDLPGLASLCQEIGVAQRFEPTVYRPEILAERISREELVGASEDQIKKIEHFLQRVQHSGHLMNASVFLKVIPVYYRVINGMENVDSLERLGLPIFSKACSVPRFHIDIFANGFVSPCVGYPPSDHNFSLKTKSLSEIVHSREYGRVVDMLGQCRKCRDEALSCYITPQLFFPVGNFIRYVLLNRFRQTID